jgi:hypothetical protein
MKILLIDANNLFFSTAIDHFSNTREPITTDAVRAVLTSRLARINRDMKKVPGEKILAFDDRRYWRRDVFEHYKASRAKQRDDQKFDWDSFFPAFNIYKDELREFFPYKSLQVERAEADDIIAILSLRASAGGDPVTIWSSDTDDLQLQLIEPKIKQYSYVRKKYITPKSEKYSLFEHIVRGDAGDGVPNILTRSDHFVNNPDGKRQKPIYEAKLLDWAQHANEPEKFCDEAMLKRLRENRVLVDYTNIPPAIAAGIVEAYETTKVPKGKLFNYMVKNRMTNVMKEAGW